MQIFKNFNKFPKYKNQEINISIGSYDGIHIGHQSIIEKLLSYPGKRGIITFSPHPLKVIYPDIQFSLLTTIYEKIEILLKEDLDFVFILNFNKELASIGAVDFIENILIKKLRVTNIVIGENFKFGHKAEGTAKFLYKCGKKYGFGVDIVSALKKDGIIVSSTAIRNLIVMGEIEKANRLLGYNYKIYGKVIRGDGRGSKKLGFPTANLSVPKDKLLPQEGVYVVAVSYLDEKYGGVLSIGKNPTFSKQRTSIEVHILNFRKNLYNKTLKLGIISRLRSQQKFETDEELSNQIKKDIEMAKVKLEKRGIFFKNKLPQ